MSSSWKNSVHSWASRARSRFSSRRRQLWRQHLPHFSKTTVRISTRISGWVKCGRACFLQFGFLFSSCNPVLPYPHPGDLMHLVSMTVFTFLFFHDNHAPSPLSQWDYLNFNRNQSIWTKIRTSNMEFQTLASRWSEKCYLVSKMDVIITRICW